MPGFVTVIAKNDKYNSFDTLFTEAKEFSIERLNYNNITIETCFSNKFPDDKFVFQDENFIIALDGMITNLDSLLMQYEEKDTPSLIIKMFYEKKEDLFKDLRGMFSGVIISKADNKVLVFTDHLMTKPVFYYLHSEFFIFASEVGLIAKYLSLFMIEKKIDITGAYLMLTYGYMFDNITLIKDVKKVMHGKVWIFEIDEIKTHKYYQIPENQYSSVSEKEAVDTLDSLFNKAVLAQHLKNQHYGKTEFAALSAGLDSRMTNFYLRKNYDGPLYNINYSETSFYDQTIPFKLAKQLKSHILFQNLDNGLSLLRFKESDNVADGLVYYAYPTQLLDYMYTIDTSKIGIVHTGVLGDAILSIHSNDSHETRFTLGYGAISQKLTEKLRSTCSRYENTIGDMNYWLTIRGLGGEYLGYHNAFKQYSEAMSPFMDVDFADYCFRLPLKYRVGYKIYNSMVHNKMPEAAKLLRNGTKIPKPKAMRIKLGRNVYYLRNFFHHFKNAMLRKIRPNHAMNPYNYWYTKNIEVKKIIDDVYFDNIQTLKIDDDLKNDIIYLYENGDGVERILVASLISSIKYLILPPKLVL